MTELRLRFEKTGKAVYISHLDLMRTLQRVFKRAGLDIKYSDGFNPHARIFIAIPLSLGYAGVCELIDIELNGDTAPENIVELINETMPAGIRVTECYSSSRKFKEIAWLRYEISLEYDNGVPEGACEKINELFTREALIVSKRTKRKNEDTNIAPGVRDLTAVEKDGGIRLTACCASSGELVLNPLYIVSAVEAYLPELKPDFARFLRTETLDRDFELFR